MSLHKNKFVALPGIQKKLFQVKKCESRKGHLALMSFGDGQQRGLSKPVSKLFSIDNSVYVFKSN